MGVESGWCPGSVCVVVVVTSFSRECSPVAELATTVLAGWLVSVQLSAAALRMQASQKRVK
jgi:hypothetical protein